MGGEISMGNSNFLGFSSVVLQGRKIGDDVLLGAQSLALSNLETLSKYHGSPATKVGSIDKKIGIQVN